MSDLTRTIEGLDKSHTRYRKQDYLDGGTRITIYHPDLPIVRKFNKDGKYVGER